MQQEVYSKAAESTGSSEDKRRVSEGRGWGGRGEGEGEGIGWAVKGLQGLGLEPWWGQHSVATPSASPPHPTPLAAGDSVKIGPAVCVQCDSVTLPAAIGTVHLLPLGLFTTG